MRKVQILTKSGELVAEGTVIEVWSTDTAYEVNRVNCTKNFLQEIGLIIKEIEEKKPVKRWLWVVLRQHENHSSIGHWEFLQNGVFYSEEDMQHFKWSSMPAPPCKKLLWSETEFEE